MNTKFDKKTKFITTTLPYINSKPHIGHAFEFILGDAISKWFKTKTNVRFNIGLDEHGLKVYTKSKELGISIDEHINNLRNTWVEFCEKFEIEYDSFYKTSDKEHHKKVKSIWNKLLVKGDIYKSDYVGKYCLGCESYKKDTELLNNRCIEHQNIEIIEVNEPNYFFKLKKYKDSLLEWLESNPQFLSPSSKLDELKNLLLEVDDISISRLKINCPWGIEVPNDSDHIIYVWFDALLNYIFAAGYETDDFIWDDVIQLCGPDNIKFQGIIFQSFLESLDIKKSGKLLVHGTILDQNGNKISKSLGNTIDPIEQLEKYGIYPVRYYCLSGLSTYTNSKWNEDDLKRYWNSDIVNDFGNLASRVLHLIHINDIQIKSPEPSFKENIINRINDISDCWDNFNIKLAFQKINQIVKSGNVYISEKEVWKSVNKEVELNNLFYLLKEVNKLYIPLFGLSKYEFIEDKLNLKEKCKLFDRL